MRLAPHINALLTWFDRRSLRERVLAIAALLGSLIVTFDLLFMSRLDARRRELSQELTTLRSDMDTASKVALAASAADPIAIQTKRAAELKAQLATTDAKLASQAAGMIAPQRMMQVLHEVLARQHGVTLVSLRYLHAAPLPDAHSAVPAGVARPYLHTVEITVQGSYLDVLGYLRALEALPWRFYWRRLELTTTRYPMNQVRLELGTVSMDSQWTGL
jgi:MSHA biogenesis protein MshJ